MSETPEPKAWRNGRYVYCLTHSTAQVIQHDDVYEGDPALWEGRRCDWCDKVLA